MKILKTQDSIILITSTLVNAFCFLVSPLLLRVLVDGILITDDINAITITMLTITFCEVSLVMMTALSRYEIDQIQSRFVDISQKRFVDRLLKSEINPSSKEIERFWFSDVQKVASIKVRNKWARIKDIVLFVILGITSISLSFSAGIFLLLFMIAQIIAGVFVNYKWGHLSEKNHKLYEEDEDLVENITKNSTTWIDEGNLQNHTKILNEKISELRDKQFNIDRTRSVSDDVLRSFRTMAVLGILWISFKAINEGTGSVGAIWALIMVAYRLINPAASLAKWGLDERRAASSVERWNKWLNSIQPLSNETPKLYSKIKSILQNSVESKLDTFVLLEKRNFEQFDESSRIWREKVTGRFKVFIFNNKILIENILDPQFSQFQKLVIIKINQNENNQLQKLRSAMLELKSNQNVTFVICSPFFSVDSQIFKNQYYYDHDNETFDSYPALTDSNRIKSMMSICSKMLRQLDDKYIELQKDIYRYQKMKLPFTLVYIPNLAEESIQSLQGAFRAYDYILPVPLKGYFVILANSEEQTAKNVIIRVFGSLPQNQIENIEYVSVLLDSKKKDFNISHVEKFIFDKLFGTNFSEYVEDNKELVA